MFTGIVTDIGDIRDVEMRGDKRFVIGCSYPSEKIAIGASIACSGICLTVTDRGSDSKGGWFAVDASTETCSLTTAAHWQAGTKLNLERALKVGDELGGHIVTGHVDGLGSLINAQQDIAGKGSITIDGVSLTVNAIDGEQFGINLIPHTQAETTLGELTAGDAVNLEIDVLARYVARLNDVREAALSKGS